MLAQNTGFFKIFSIFGIAILLIIWLTPTVIGLVKAVKSGDWNEALKQSGGRLFAIDSTLKDETDYLLASDDINLYEKSFHLAYSFSLIFMILIVCFGLFKFANWLIGIKQFSPSSDVMIVILIVAAAAILQFAYTYFILGKTLIPFKDGMWYFLKNLPVILNKMMIV